MSEKFYHDQPRCNGNENEDKITYNSSCTRDISEMLASNSGFSGSGYWMTLDKFYHNQPPVPQGLRDRLSNDVSQISRGAMLVVMATKFQIIAYILVCILW